MSISKIKILKILEKIEQYCGIHRNFTALSSRCHQCLIIVHVFIIIIIFVTNALLFQFSTRKHMDSKSHQAIWIMFLFTQNTESLSILILALRYSKPYNELIRKLNDINYLVVSDQKIKKDYYHYILIYELILFIIGFLAELILESKEIQFSWVRYFQAFSIYLAMLLHIMQSTLCSTIYLSIADILISFDLIVANHVEEHVRNSELKIEFSRTNYIVNDLCNLYLELIKCCDICKDIFFSQLLLCLTLAFVYNFSTIFGAFNNTEEMSGFLIFAYVNFSMLLCSVFLTLTYSGQCVCIASKKLQRSIAMLNNNLRPEVLRGTPANALLRLLTAHPLRLVLLYKLEIDMSLVPAFVGLTASQIIIFLQFQNI